MAALGRDDHRVEQLAAFARHVGVETSYYDVAGKQHTASVDSLLAILRIMGHDVNGLASVSRAIETHARKEATWPTLPQLVAWIGRPFRFELRLPSTQPVVTIELVVEDRDEGKRSIGRVDLATVPSVELDDGRTAYTISVPSFDVAPGYHDLWIDGVVGGPLRRPLIAAPPKVASLQPLDRLWGVFAPVYSLVGGTGLGAHVGDLGRLARVIDGIGGKIVGTLPLLAAWLGEPFDPSPYSPISRLHWNELYVDLAALPELRHVPKALENLDGLRTIGHAANERTKTFDYRHQSGYVRGVLQQVIDGQQLWPADLLQSFHDATARDADGGWEYARFRAYADKVGSGWHSWPEPQRSGTIGEHDVDPFDVMMHELGDHAMQRDLQQLNRELVGRGQHLYLDLPVGVSGDGYDTWRHRELFGWGAAAGAPPDDFFSEGQNWGFPPILPLASTEGGHSYLRDVLRHHMEVAGILRIDHVMGLHRLYWIPDGMDAKDGVYVRYPREELLAVLAIESVRSGCVVVGEDLGTVPDVVREAMDDHGLLGMYVAEFMQPSWEGAAPDEPAPDQLASIDTHDTPTFSGWLHGFDVDRRHQMGMLTDEEADQERGARRQQVQNLTAFLQLRGDLAEGRRRQGLEDAVILEGLLRFLGDSDAPALLVSLDDLVQQTNPQNVPGTMTDRPNWVQRFPLAVDDLLDDEQVDAILQAVQACRLGSHLRAKDQAHDHDD